MRTPLLAASSTNVPHGHAVSRSSCTASSRRSERSPIPESVSGYRLDESVDIVRAVLTVRVERDDHLGGTLPKAAFERRDVAPVCRLLDDARTCVPGLDNGVVG